MDSIKLFGLVLLLLIAALMFFGHSPPSASPASSTLTTAPSSTTTSCGWVGVGVTVLRGGRAPEQDHEYRCTTTTTR